jgi:hypothetical protein
LFVHSETDLVLSDILPVYVTRNYRQGDSVVRPFGLGTSHPFATYLRWPTNSVVNDTYMWMVLSDGSTKTFNRIATSPVITYEYTGTDPTLHKAQWNSPGSPEHSLRCIRLRTAAPMLPLLPVTPTERNL